MSNRNYEAVPLETERLILKKGSIEDYEKVFEYNFIFLRGIGGIFEYRKLSDGHIKKWYPEGIEKSHLKSEENHEFAYIIYLKDGTPIGHIDASNENKDMDNSVELSFNLHPNYWGQGYIVEACTILMNHLFNIGYENILLGYEATDTDENYKSKRVSEKLGFEFLKEKEPFFHPALGIEVKSVLTVINKEKFRKMEETVNVK